MISTCSWIMDDESECGERCEGNTPFCGSHNRQLRREEAEAKKQVEKKANLIAQAALKNQIPRAKINNVSEKQKSLNEQYKEIADDFKRRNPACVVRVNQYCTGKTESVHHKRGRGRYYLDVSTFLPCCLSCHSYIEAHPKEAKERGWSESRLATTEPHKI